MDHQPQEIRGRGKNKRKWNNEEDAKLVDALLDMVNLGTYKAENGFKPGYLNFVEDKLRVSLPNSGFKAKPHIESRIKTLKRDFNIVYDMLNGPNTSGFGMDPIKKCIVAEKAVWDSYLQ
ncbi:DNA-binding storekeeper protein-relatedtranscriptional regulator, partial [Striga asiatica]